MEPKYHYNPATGKTGRCPAVIKCRLLSSDGHFNTEAEARAAYEQTMESELLNTSTKKTKPRRLFAAVKSFFSMDEEKKEEPLPSMDEEGSSAEDQPSPIPKEALKRLREMEQAERGNMAGAEPVLSYNQREDGGKMLKVGELLAKVKPGHELVIRRFEGLDDEDEQTDQSELLSQGQSGDKSGAYWNDENGKINGVFVFPLSLFNKDLTLDQTALHMNLILQNEMENYRYGAIGTYVVAEVKKSELQRPKMIANYDVFQDESHFEEMKATNPGMKHGFDPDTFDGLYRGSSKEGKLMDVPEYSWDLNSKATEVHAFFGPDVDRWQYEQEEQ